MHKYYPLQTYRYKKVAVKFAMLLITLTVAEVSAEKIPDKYESILKEYEVKLQEDPTNFYLIKALADAYFYYKIYPKAIELYQKALVLHPNDNNVKLSLAFAYLGVNDFSAAQNLLEQVSSKDPNNVKVLSGLGRIEALHQNYKKAEELYTKALDSHPADFNTLYFVGELYLEEKKYKQAEQVFTQLLKVNPKATWVQQALTRVKNGPLLSEIELLEEKGSYEEAIDRVSNQLKNQPEDSELTIVLSDLFIKTKRNNEAIILLQNMAKKKPDNSAILAAIGNAYSASGEIVEAETAFKNSLKLDPANALAFVGLGKIAEKFGKKNEAINFYQNALKNDPSNFSALTHLANLYLAQKNYQEAMLIYEKLLKLKPAAPWIVQAQERAKLGPEFDQVKELEHKHAYSEAAQKYQQLLSAYPTNLELYLNLGELLTKLQRYDDAIYIYNVGIEKTHFPEYLWVDMANTYLAKGALDAAKNIFIKVLARDEKQADALAGLGKIAAMQQNYDLAEKYFQQVLAFDRENLTALSYLAQAKLRQKQYEEAEELYQKIIDFNPDALWAKEAEQLAEISAQLDEAREYIKDNKLGKAEKLLQKLLVTHPSNLTLYLELGNLYLYHDQPGKAIDIYQQGQQKLPNESELQVGLGLAYLASKEYKRAEEIFSNVLAYDIKNASALAGLGRIKAIEGNVEKAQNFYEKALSYDQDNVVALSYLVDLLFNKKKYAEAQKIYEKLLVLEPNQNWIKIALENTKHGPILEEIKKKTEKKDFDAAEKLYQQLIKESPKNSDYYLMFGNFFASQKKFQEATTLYLQGLNLAPSDLYLNEALADIYIEKNELLVARNILEKIYDLDPSNAEIVARLGLVAEKQGFSEKAFNLYEKALEIDPNSITALSSLANFYKRQHNYSQELKLLEKIYEIDPEALWAKDAFEKETFAPLLDEIKRQQANKNFSEVENLYNKLARDAPNIIEFAIESGQFFVGIKKYQRAVDIYQEALKVHPDNVELLVALGYAYLSFEKQADSAASFQQALLLDAKNSSALAGLGQLALLKNNFSEAENYLQKAYQIDPESVAVLSSIANLRMAQKRYEEAEQIYEGLSYRFPSVKWIKFAFNEAKYAPALNDIRREEQSNHLEKAAKMYENLLFAMPDNAYYYLGLGQIYVRLKRFESAWQLYQKGLELLPEANEIRIAWGYSYLYSEKPYQAIKLLQQALEHGSATAEILAGLGRAYTLSGDKELAEELFLQALQKNPYSVSALTFYAKFLSKEKRYEQAQEIYYRLWQLDTQVRWVVNAWEDARDGLIIDEGKCFENELYFDEALEIYRALVCYAPQNPERYSLLGRIYLSLEKYNQSIDAYQAGLQIDPSAAFLWRGLAFAYIKQQDYDTSRTIFTDLVNEDKTDAEAWTGLALVDELDGSEAFAEQYYQMALDIDPENITALSYLADFRKKQQNIWAAAQLYRHLMLIDAKEKWVRIGYQDILNQISPTVTEEAHYHQEDQWTREIDRWTARYWVYGGFLSFNYPLTCSFTLGGKGANDFYTLQDEITHTTEYAFDVKRAYGMGKWILSPHFAFNATLGASYYSSYHSSTFKPQRGSVIEPSAIFTYQKRKERALFGFMSDTDLVARNFKTNHAKMVGRYFLRGQYQREVIQYGTIGFEADAYFYSDYVKNRAQALYGWFDWRPPCYHKYVILRYFCKYQTFNKNIPDYYTYKYQLINHFQLTLERNWNVCWADLFYTNIGYAHGWQDTRTRFKQIIVVNPVPVTPCSPYFMDRRNYNYFFSNINYKKNRLQLNLNGNYYRDSQRYTIWEILANCTWRF